MAKKTKRGMLSHRMFMCVTSWTIITMFATVFFMKSAPPNLILKCDAASNIECGSLLSGIFFIIFLLRNVRDSWSWLLWLLFHEGFSCQFVGAVLSCPPGKGFDPAFVTALFSLMSYICILSYLAATQRPNDPDLLLE